MVKYFQDKPGELPGGDEPGVPTDISSWRDIYVTAKKLIRKCVHKEKAFGWARAGMSTHPRNFFLPWSPIIHRIYSLPKVFELPTSFWLKSKVTLGELEFLCGPPTRISTDRSKRRVYSKGSQELPLTNLHWQLRNLRLRILVPKLSPRTAILSEEVHQIGTTKRILTH